MIYVTSVLKIHVFRIMRSCDSLVIALARSRDYWQFRSSHSSLETAQHSRDRAARSRNRVGSNNEFGDVLTDSLANREFREALGDNLANRELERL